MRTVEDQPRPSNAGSGAGFGQGRGWGPLRRAGAPIDPQHDKEPDEGAGQGLDRRAGQPAPGLGAPCAPASARLAALLAENGIAKEEDLGELLAEHARTHLSLARLALDRNVTSEAQLAQLLAGHLGLDYVDLAEYSIDPAAAGLVSQSLAWRHMALPIGFEGRVLVVALADPANLVALDDIRTVTGRDVKVVVASRPAIKAALERYRQVDGDAEGISAEVAAEMGNEDDLSRIDDIVDDAPIVRLVNLLVTQAVAERASDVHIEPGELDVRVRYRIDGVLHEAMRLQKPVQAGVISRLKIMAGVDIAERRLPQDGRISMTVGGRALDLRVSTLPTAHGEKVVLRILDTANALLQLSDLGFLPDALATYRASYTRPYGTILVTGPTGSGKSTTLYSTLNVINDDARNIITVEDPVEYRLAGINQVQVNQRAGLTFATALRSILRADPDVILVGEIRDRETATIAIEAALTGHLVLSSLHTNNAATTPMRLVEMGVEPFLVASALDCIVAQRLARRLCARCKEAYEPTPGELASLGWGPEASDRPERLWRAAGCPACSRTGYKGRFAIHEVLTVSEEVERMIVEREHAEDIKKVALAQGMVTLRRSGLAQAAAGVTSVEEVLRVVA